MSGTAGDLPNFVGICQCNSPHYDTASARVSQELVSNRIGPEVKWMLEPWQSGPPFDVAGSYMSMCNLAMKRLDCPDGSVVSQAGAEYITVSNPNGYTCSCGNFKALFRVW